MTALLRSPANPTNSPRFMSKVPQKYCWIPVFRDPGNAIGVYIYLFIIIAYKTDYNQEIILENKIDINISNVLLF